VRPPTPEELRRMQIVSVGLLAGVASFSLIVLFLRPSMAKSDLPLLAWAAAAWALVSPAVASIFQRRMEVAVDNPVGAHIALYGMLEGAIFFCLIALLLVREAWPLTAMAVPLAFMVLRFPRAS